MKMYKESAILLILFLINVACCDKCNNSVNREDHSCITLCENTPLSFTNSKYVKSCCQRGCRFFNLIELSGLEPIGLNGTRNACEASCTEAYAEAQDRYACSTGCDFMAKQRVSDWLSLLSFAIYVEEESVDSNTLLMSPDIPENDILKDPGIRKELHPRWWNSNGFKLPQTYIKTVPMDAGTVDYGIPSDYSGESEQTSSWIPGSDWFQCASKHVGMPSARVASVAAAAVALLAVCLYLYSVYTERTRDNIKELVVDKPRACDKVTIYIPDEAPIHKKPPPKYADINDGLDVSLKV